MSYAHSVRPEQMDRISADVRMIPRSPEPSHAERSKSLVHSTNEGFLSTIGYKPEGYPFGSVVRYALSDDGLPLLCLSQLAEHTKNLLRNPKSSLMVTEQRDADADPLEKGRVTLVGDLRAVEGTEAAEVRDAYLSSFPSAYYMDFDDFDFYRLDLEAVRYVGGFGMMSWVRRADYLVAQPDPLRPFARDIVEHMNQDHSDALLVIVQASGEVEEPSSAVMTTVDRYGFDVSVNSGSGRRAMRIRFTRDIGDSDACRVEMISLLTQARKALGLTNEGKTA